MNSNITRRSFIQTVGCAGAALAVVPVLPAAEETPKITLGFVGCAHIHTPSFVNLLKNRKDVKVKYVWDHDQARAAKRAGDLGTKIAQNLDEIWTDPEVAAVVICSETNRHLDLVTAAAKAGKHMFVEKPLGITAKDSFAMAEAIEKAKVIFTTGYFMRTDPKHLFLKEQIAQGNFGKITRVRGSNCHSGSLGGWFDTEWRWMADPKIAGVGGFGDLGTHSLDILMWLLGDIESVTADIKVVTGRYGQCDESGEALIKFKSGVTGTLAGGWVDVANPVTLLISGTEGHATIVNNDLFFQSKKVQGASGKEPWDKLPKGSREPMHLFVDAVAGQKNLPLVTPREAAARVSVMEAMYASARKHKWVNPA
jgi:predicted dehydrogenase